MTSRAKRKRPDDSSDGDADANDEDYAPTPTPEYRKTSRTTTSSSPEAPIPKPKPKPKAKPKAKSQQASMAVPTTPQQRTRTSQNSKAATLQSSVESPQEGRVPKATNTYAGDGLVYHQAASVEHAFDSTPIRSRSRRNTRQTSADEVTPVQDNLPQLECVPASKPAEQELVEKMAIAMAAVRNVQKSAVTRSRALETDLQLAEKQRRILSEKCKALIIEKTNLEAVNGELEKENIKLRKQDDAKSQENYRLTNKIVAMSSEFKDQPKGYKLVKKDDDFLGTLWDQLSFHINTLSVRLAIEVVKSPPTAREGCRFRNNLLQVITIGRCDPQLCSALLKNWVWMCVKKDIIESTDGPWPAPFAKSFMPFYYSIRDHLERGEISAGFVSQTKAAACCEFLRTYRAQARKHPDNPSFGAATEQEVIYKLFTEMLDDISCLWKCSKEDHAYLKQELRMIVNNAGNLQMCLLASKAIFHVGTLDDHAKPADDLPHGQPPHGTWRIVVRPSLRKRGTMNGEELDQISFLRPTEVFDWSPPVAASQGEIAPPDDIAVSEERAASGVSNETTATSTYECTTANEGVISLAPGTADPETTTVAEQTATEATAIPYSAAIKESTSASEPLLVPEIDAGSETTNSDAATMLEAAVAQEAITSTEPTAVPGSTLASEKAKPELQMNSEATATPEDGDDATQTVAE